MKVEAIKTRIFHEGENLLSFILENLTRLDDKSVLVVTSKIVSLSEKRTAQVKNLLEKQELIIKESTIAIPTDKVWLTIKDDTVMASAGIDESNGDGKLILLPKNSFNSAKSIRKALMKHFKLVNLGVIVSDSRTMPLRLGVVGFALGYAGFKGIKSYKDKKDLFGRKFKFSKANVADSLATSAALNMGEGDESRPLAIINNPPIKFCLRNSKDELKIDPKEDMYRPIFEKIC